MGIVCDEIVPIIGHKTRSMIAYFQKRVIIFLNNKNCESKKMSEDHILSGFFVYL